MEIHTSKPLINIKVFILLFLFLLAVTYSNPCTLDNGKICEHSCLKSFNTILCTCPDGHYLHNNRYKCVGKLCCSAITIVVSFRRSCLRKERREGKEKLTNKQRKKRTTTNQMNKQTDRPNDRQIDLYFDFISQMSMSATCLHVNMTAITLLGHITVLVFLDFLFNRIEKDAKVIKL